MLPVFVRQGRLSPWLRPAGFLFERLQHKNKAKRPRASRRFREPLSKPMKHRIEFSPRRLGAQAYVAEVEAPTYQLAQRTALEHAAANGITLAHLNIHGVSDLKEARLDGINFLNCGLANVSFVKASLKGATFIDCTLDHVEADDTTDMSGATLERVDIDCSRFRGTSLRNANIVALRLFQTDAAGLDLTGATVHTLKARLGTTTGWKLMDCVLQSVDGLSQVIGQSDHTENEKGAIRLLAGDGNRAAARLWLDRLNAGEA